MANHHGQKAPLRKNNIGLIVPRINRNFFSNIIHGIESVTDINGYNLIICQSNKHLNSEISKIHALIEAQVAGIVATRELLMRQIVPDAICSAADNIPGIVT